MPTLEDRFRGCLLGLACGDAVGTTVEFRSRGTFALVTDMVGQGPFQLPAGAWTDDTSMALCLATSLVTKRGFDPADQMQRYCQWQDSGYLSSTGACFDIGMTISSALRHFRQTGEPYSGSDAPDTAGNGSIMRLAPVPMGFFPDLEAVIHFAALSSQTTHGARECVDACKLFGAMLHKALAGESKDAIVCTHGALPTLTGSIQAIAQGAYRQKAIEDIRGSGYVVQGLEAALWCFWRTETFAAAILQATNLGDDADTTAAVCGQIAGAYYGASGIPSGWLQRLVMRDDICALADQLRLLELQHPGEL